MAKIKAQQKVKITSGSTKGMGYLSWDRLNQRLRESGELTDQQELKTITLADEGVYFTTGKPKK